MNLKLFFFAFVFVTSACAAPTQSLTPPVQSTPQPTRAALSTPGAGGVPNFINHTPPSYSVDFTPIRSLQCPIPGATSSDCDPNNPYASLGCDEIQEPSFLLGALNPSFPIALCFVVPSERPDHQEPQPDSYFFRQGGLRGEYARYLIHRNNQFQVLENANEFKTMFAPIESPDEAIGYAIAVTGLDAVYGLKYEPEYIYSTNTIEDTFALPDGDGYLVRLYHFREFGCGPHEMVAFDLHVSHDGTIQEVGRQAIYRDPKMDGLCVD